MDLPDDEDLGKLMAKLADFSDVNRIIAEVNALKAEIANEPCENHPTRGSVAVAIIDGQGLTLCKECIDGIDQRRHEETGQAADGR